MKRILIDIVIISVLYLVIAFIVVPRNELKFNHFAGLVGVLIYNIGKVIVVKIREKKTA